MYGASTSTESRPSAGIIIADLTVHFFIPTLCIGARPVLLIHNPLDRPADKNVRGLYKLQELNKSW